MQTTTQPATFPTPIPEREPVPPGGSDWRWVRHWRWNPERNIGYVEFGGAMYRVARQDGDDRCETWEVRKVSDDHGLAAPYTVTLPTPGSGFPASCTCPAWQFAKTNPRQCRHTLNLAAALDGLANSSEPDDDAVERMEREARLAALGEADPFA